MDFLLDHPKLVQLVLPSSKSVLPEAELAQPTVLSTPWDPNVWVLLMGVAAWGGGERAAQYF